MTIFTLVGPSTDAHIRKVYALLNVPGNSVFVVDTNVAFSATSKLMEDGLLRELAGVVGSDVDLVWLFRPTFSLPDLELVDPEDRPGLIADTAIFERWTLETFATEAAWINSYGAHLRGSNKSLQAQVARACGLLVPPTLLSNRPDDIRAFVANGTTIFKPLSRHVTSDPRWRIMSTAICSADLPSDEQLALQPCYLQRMIEKVAEWRVHVMGDEVIAFRLWPREIPHYVDWNFDREKFCIAERVLDDDVCKSLRRMMHLLDLKFACIDLLEDSKGLLHFLELNQMGRFLWVDGMLPQARLGERFADFLKQSAQRR